MRSNGMMGVVGAALALVVVALLGASTPLSRSRHGACHEHGPNARFDRLEAELGKLALATDTRAAAEHLLAQARTDREAHREQMRDAHQALRELLEQDTPALEPVLAQADAIGALGTEAHKAQLRTMIELRSLLSPEQWQALRASLRDGRSAPMEKS